MIKKLLLSFVLSFAACALHAQQDLERVKSLLNRAQYEEGARLLRPLADGGNAEAQLIAAELFFKGLGVTQSYTQGIKYATMSAKSGYMNALILLIKHYNKEKPAQALQLLGTYLNSFPDKATDLSKYMEDEDVHNTVLKYFEGQINGCTDTFDFIEKIYGKAPAEGELLISIALNDKDGKYVYKECKKQISAGNMSAACQATLAKLYFEGKSVMQHHASGMRYARAAAAENSAMGKYLVQKYADKRMPGYYFRDAVIFETDKGSDTDKAYSRTQTMLTWKEVLAQMRKSRTWRLPTMDEAKKMMKYYTWDKGMKTGETVTIWVEQLSQSEVYYWQTYNHEGQVIKEEPHHNFLGSHYGGKALMIPILELHHKE